MPPGHGLASGILEIVRLNLLMQRTSGDPRIAIGLIDGPVAMTLSQFEGQRIRELPSKLSGRCTLRGSEACKHGTFVAAMLCAKRDSGAPAICSGCTLLVRSIFPEDGRRDGAIPSASPKELARAIVQTVDAGARGREGAGGSIEAGVGARHRPRRELR